MAQGQVDCGVLQETKLTDGVYTWGYNGYQVMLTAAPSAHRGGTAILYHEVVKFAIKEIHFHGPNVIISHLVMGRWRWHVVGYYIAPSNDSTIEDVAAVIMIKITWPISWWSLI